MAGAAAELDAYMTSLEEGARRVAPGEWGLAVDAAGWPLHVGIAVREGLLRAQAVVVEPGRLEAHELLVWNRGLPHVRFTHTEAGEVWIQGELPPGVVDARWLDRFLGVLVRAATLARERAYP